MISFGRLFRPSVTVICAGQTVTDINIPPPAPRGPKIAFQVTKSLTSEPDEAKVSIFNLDPVREKVLGALFAERGTTPLQILAGYEGTVARVFNGDVRSMKPHTRVLGDYAWVASADDAGDALSTLSVSYTTAGWTVQQMIDVALLRINTGDPTVGTDLKPLVLPYPLAPHPSVATAVASSRNAGTILSGVYAGQVTDLLDEAARILGVRWWIADNLLYMAARRLPVDQLVIVLDRKKWLAEPSDDGSGLVRLPTFFDPNIIPGRQITLVDTPVGIPAGPGSAPPLFKRSAVPELFRCEAVEYSGDTRGTQPWRADMMLRRFP